MKAHRHNLLIGFTVLKRKVTCEELLEPGAPFIKKVLTVSYENYTYKLLLRFLIGFNSTNLAYLSNIPLKTKSQKVKTSLTH